MSSFARCDTGVSLAALLVFRLHGLLASADVLIALLCVLSSSKLSLLGFGFT